MKHIPLTQGQVAKVDDADFKNLSRFMWCAVKKRSGFYAVRESSVADGAERFYMHRVIMGNPAGMKVDHKNHDTLDNRRENLRVCTAGQNNSHRSGCQKNSKSGVRGVFWHKGAGKWRAAIRFERKTIHLGLFVDIAEAESAYKRANEELFGAFGGKTQKEKI